MIKKKGLVKSNYDRVETPVGEYGCVNMGEFAIALSKELSRNEASLKAYTRIYAPEAPMAQQDPETLLNMRFVNKHVQALLSPKTALIVETGGTITRQSERSVGVWGCGGVEGLREGWKQLASRSTQ